MTRITESENNANQKLSKAQYTTMQEMDYKGKTQYNKNKAMNIILQ